MSGPDRLIVSHPRPVRTGCRSNDNICLVYGETLNGTILCQLHCREEGTNGTPRDSDTPQSPVNWTHDVCPRTMDWVLANVVHVSKSKCGRGPTSPNACGHVLQGAHRCCEVRSAQEQLQESIVINTSDERKSLPTKASCNDRIGGLVGFGNL